MTAEAIKYLDRAQDTRRRERERGGGQWTTKFPGDWQCCSSVALVVFARHAGKQSVLETILNRSINRLQKKVQCPQFVPSRTFSFFFILHQFPFSSQIISHYSLHDGTCRRQWRQRKGNTKFVQFPPQAAAVTIAPG